MSDPRCSKHNEAMTLYIYDRPGGPPGNGWSCRTCTEERTALREPTPSVDPPKHECKVNEERIVCSCGVNLGITMGTDNPFWFAEAVCFIFAQHLLESRGSQAHEK